MANSGLILGCGYLGQRMARAWVDQQRKVYAVTRSRADFLLKQGIEPIVGDVLDPATLQHLPKVDTVLYAVGFDRSSQRSMREIYVQGLRNVLERLPDCQRFLYVSSTGVYGHTDGTEVDETSPTEPREESGKVVLEAEQTLRALRPDAFILRFAGIYGPNRLLRKQPLLNGDPFVGDADKWLNLIHRDDGVRALLQAEISTTKQRLFNISDGNPVTRRAFYTRLAELLNAPTARFETPATAANPEPNRRVVSALARSELEFVPQFPSYSEGLAASLGID
jgi:nucleoside-diphosphate-sugar epimerase